MLVNKKYTNKEEVLNKIIKRIEDNVNDVEKIETVAKVVFLGIFNELIKMKLNLLKYMLSSPLAKDFDKSIFIEDSEAVKLVYGDIDVEYHIRVTDKDTKKTRDYLLFEAVLNPDIINPDSEERFAEEIEILAENIAEDFKLSIKEITQSISYVKLTHKK